MDFLVAVLRVDRDKKLKVEVTEIICYQIIMAAMEIEKDCRSTKKW